MTAVVLSIVTLTTATPARADGINNFLAGVQGLLQFPADPVMEVVYPSDEFEDLPAFPVTGRVLGVFTGTLLGVYRAGTGAGDVVTPPLWILPTMSPEARWEWIPGVEYGE